MRKLVSLLSLIALLTAGGTAQERPAGKWILERVDENIGSDNKIWTSEMIIHGRRGSRSITSRTWLQGTSESFTEYLAPAREEGTKMLKLKDQLWIFYPSTDRTILISGHMLRQSVMGSDLSYEDAMEDPVLANSYDSEVSAEETVLERPCWRLVLTAREPGLAYHSRQIWVDKERFVVLKEERYARSGRLLKRTEVMSVIQVENRWIPGKTVFKDVLKDGRGTEFIVNSIEFNADIPEHVFSKASLKK